MLGPSPAGSSRLVGRYEPGYRPSQEEPSVRNYYKRGGSATKYLMELVVPKKLVVIKVDILLREDYRKQTCAASWESPTPVYPHLTHPIPAL